MVKWKRTMAVVLGGLLVLSQGMVSMAEEDMTEGVGSDAVASESAMPQMGTGLGMDVPAAGSGTVEGLAGTMGMGSGADLGFFDEEGAAESGDTDTCMLDDIQLALRIQGSYMLTDAEDEGFYYIYTWGEQGIPDMIIGRFDLNTTQGFFDQYTENMKQVRADLSVAEGPVSETIGDKQLEKIVYSYTIQGYNVKDTCYIWAAPNSALYMFAKREIPDLGYTLGDSLENIITSASLPGMQTTAPQPETTAPQPETSAPVPSGGNDLYTQNADSSWTVATQYYTMTIPPAWTGHFEASLLELYDTGYNLEVVNKESADANFGGHLFTVMLVPENEDYTVFPSYDYLGTMSTPEGVFHVVVRYPTDVQTGDIWSEFYKILNGDKNTAITSIRPVAGVTWTLPNGNTISGETAAPQPETTAPQPETTAPQPETTVPVPPSGGDVLGTTDGSSYTNSLFGFRFSAPAGWILANQDQLVSLNENLAADQFVSSIESGVPVCVAYAQSSNGMEVMNVVVENGKSFLDASVSSLTQEDVKAILTEAMSLSSSALESLGATVTGAAVNSVNCLGQTCYSLDINFTYGDYSGTQKQIGIPAGTYIALITARSVSGDNTQAMFDMFSAA